MKSATPKTESQPSAQFPKTSFRMFLSLLLACLLTTFVLPSRATAKGGIVARPRVIVLTDINAYTNEPDDAESLVRVMLYSNEMDIEGIIATPAWCCQTVDQDSVDRIKVAINAYGTVRSNLLVHASGYPTTQYLLDRVKLGTPNWGMANVGSGKSNAGSRLIISAVDSADPRPVWISDWTGLTTLAQALWDVKNTRTQAQIDAFAGKLRIYDIDGQDDCGAWIMKEFPLIPFYRSDCQFLGMSSMSHRIGDTSVFTDDWVATNIQCRGALGAAYPTKIYGYETDSPALMYMIPNGLNDPDEQSWGGWGGRFTADKVLNPPACQAIPIDESAYKPFYGYLDAKDTWSGNRFYEALGARYYYEDLFAPVARWRVPFQNDMAVRMNWSINSTYSACNHNPIAILNGDTTKNILSVKAAPGSELKLSAAGSSDPDGDTLTYNWYVYPEAGTYTGSVTITNPTNSVATVQVPGDLNDRSIHVILEIKDNGKGFPLYAYRRAVITSNKASP